MSARTCFVTGYPGFIGRRLVRALYERYPEVSLCLLVQPRQEKAARADLARFAREDDGRVQVVIGDITDMHLGLSSDEYRSLTQRVTDIFHLAAVYQLDTDPKAMRQVNVEGTRNVLELAADCPNLVRFNHMSTSVVSGDREGVVAEDELDQGQAFRSLYEETKFEAEKLVQQARRRLPVSIYRPGIVVGDSKTGEIDRFDGPYYLAILLVTSPIAVPLPLPGSAVAPLNVVPVDFVVDAVLHIAHDPRGAGKTFHLVDPNPMAARRVYEQIALRTGKKLPPLRLSYRIADKLLRMPLLERLVRDERAAIASVNHLAIFNGHNTLELLDGTGIRCPQLTSYLDTLVDFVERDYARRKELPESEPHDALGGSAP